MKYNEKLRNEKTYGDYKSAVTGKQLRCKFSSCIAFIFFQTETIADFSPRKAQNFSVREKERL